MYEPRQSHVSHSQPVLNPAVDQQVRTLRIIVASLVMGCVTFLCVALYVREQLGRADTETPLITYVGLVGLPVALGLRFLVPTQIARATRQRLIAAESGADSTDQSIATQLGMAYQTRTIIAGALLEGPTFLFLVAYLVEGSPIAIACAVVLTVALALHFPTSSRVENWIGEQIRLVEQEKHLQRA